MAQAMGVNPWQLVELWKFWGDGFEKGGWCYLLKKMYLCLPLESPNTLVMALGYIAKFSENQSTDPQILVS